jgi:hypothetical protein
MSRKLKNAIPSSKSLVCCLKCKSTVTSINFSKHYDSKLCNGGGKFKIENLINCKYCDLSFVGFSATKKASHSRWCEFNPRSKIDKENLAKRKNLYPIKDKDSWKNSISDAHKRGCYSNSTEKGLQTKIKNGTLYPTEETKKKISIAAQNSEHQRVCKKSHKFVDKIGREFIFDSSWEDALAIRLDELSIDWIRPPPIKYTLNGKSKNYFPDFYLPGFNLYLDPKNSYCIKVQKEKIEIVSKQINLLILESLQDCKNFTI